jgi:hypothetical protein
LNDGDGNVGLQQPMGNYWFIRCGKTRRRFFLLEDLPSGSPASRIMASSINRILQGRHLSYKVLEVLQEPSIFKAAIVSTARNSQHAHFDNKPWIFSVLSKFPCKISDGFYSVVIKDITFERELRAHHVPAVKASPYIRQALDVIEKREDEDWRPSPSSVTKRVVLEWMDTDLWHARPFGKGFSNPRLPQIVARSILEALLVFQEIKGVHTGMLHLYLVFSLL